MKEAMFYRKLKNNLVKCDLCNHKCTIAPDKFGICHVRKNIKGKLYSLVYGKAIAANVDPIEKKPFFHFLPGPESFSIATIGCNFSCKWCQNFSISQFSKEQKKIVGENLPPKRVVELAKENSCKSISYTYTEPTIFFEYAYDTAKLAKKSGLKNTFVTNGYYTEEVLKKMKGLIDAANIDLKNFDEKLHLKFCGAKLQPVLDSIKRTFEAGIWVEITTLVIPGINDSEKILNGIARFIASVDENIPWHVSRFFPMYNMLDILPTPEQTLLKAWEIGKKAGLSFVYVGNIIDKEKESTYCPNCKRIAIERVGYRTKTNLDKDRCANCGHKIPVII